MDLTQVLEATISADKNELEAAQKYLEQAAVSNLPEFMAALSNVLVDASKTHVARTAAGLQLKNYLTSKDTDIRANYQEQWFKMDESTRTHIKTNVLNTLGTEAGLSSAAQCIAGIALAELPLNRWPELIKTLVENVTGGKGSEKAKEDSLEAIGYICQDVDSNCLTVYSEAILQAIVTGMKPEEADTVKYAATNALLNSLEFTRGVFEKELERNIIMTFVCRATQNVDKKVKVAGLQCLVRIVSLYYEFMEAYMGPALFSITLDAMKSEEDEVALQGIEFWSTICDEELDLAIEATEAQENNIAPAHFSRFYAKGALQYLVPILLATLTKQEEFDDEDDWCPSKAAGVCLMLLSTCCTNDVVGHVLPFVTENIKSLEWKFRDAAVMAFGCILEGPEPDALKPLVLQAMPLLLELMKDQSVAVRDSVAWTMSRICEQVPEAALDDANLDNLLNVLLESLQSEPRVACNVCWAFSSLADAAYESTPSEDEDGPRTYCLSGRFQFIVERLLQTAERQDANQSNLRSAAYEAVMELVKNSPKDCYETVTKTILTILDRINKILVMEGSGASIGDHSQHNDFKSLLCATLQSALRKLESTDAAQIADPCMDALLQMLNVSKVGGVQEDAFMAVGVLIEAVGDKFLKYLHVFNPFLQAGLQNRAEYQVCIAAVGVVGDLCRALGMAILPYCNDFMKIFLECLSDSTVHRSVKPHVLSIFGDIALAIGPEFKLYAGVVLHTLKEAASAQVDKTDYDMLDYLNELREACLESYTGVVQGLKGEDEKNINPEVKVVGEHVYLIISFIETIALDPDRTDSLVGGCCGLLGDLCTAFGTEMMTVVENQSLQDLLQEGRRSKTNKTKTTAVWASKIARSLRK